MGAEAEAVVGAAVAAYPPERAALQEGEAVAAASLPDPTERLRALDS